LICITPTDKRQGDSRPLDVHLASNLRTLLRAYQNDKRHAQPAIKDPGAPGPGPLLCVVRSAKGEESDPWPVDLEWGIMQMAIR
jgi:hypothetical protein